MEAVNNTIKSNLKKKLEAKKGAWAEELPFILWAYRTTVRNATGETLFSLAFGIETVVPVETEVPTYRVDTFDEKENDEAMRLELDLIDEKRYEALTCPTAQKRKVEKYYNTKVKRRIFAVGSLLLMRVFQNTQVQGANVLGVVNGAHKKSSTIYLCTFDVIKSLVCNCLFINKS